MKRTTLAAAMVLACSILLSSGAIAQGPQPPQVAPLSERAPGYASDVVLVKFRQIVQITNSRGGLATGKDPLDRLQAVQGVQLAERLMPGGQGPYVASAEAFGLDRIYRLRVAPGRDPVSVAAALSADPGVEYAELDYTAVPADTSQMPMALPAASGPAATIPNDPLYADQWGLATIHVATAWDVVTGTPGIVIAMIDSGIDTNHEDLIPNLWVNPGEIPGNGIDDDNNGYVDDIQGWNFVSNSNDVQDGYGHGTQVAGLAAAATNNGAGVAGMCWNCRIMPVKVMADSGVANYSDIAAGVAYATAKGASVINLSLGGYADSRTLRDAIAAALAQGVVVVAGAGNDGISAPFYPAAYPNVLAVAATTITDTLAASSNRGAWVSVAAPGAAITTTYLGGGYGAASGTSTAAPFASGLAGLIRSRWSAWTEAMVRSQIRQTADDIDTLNPGLAGQTGKGRINAAAAMQDPYPVLTVSGIAVNGDPLGRPTPGQTATLAVTLRNDWWDATGTTASISTDDSYVTLLSSNSSFGTITTGAAAESTPVYSFAVASGAGYNHPIPFSLSIKVDGIAYGAALPFTITTRSSEEQIPARTLTDTVWTSDKTYVVNGNISVATGYTMTIQPGTEVRFSGNFTFSVGGTLIADGTADQPIVFRPYAPGGTWNRIYFRDSSIDAVVDADGAYRSGTILRHVQVLSATSGLVCGGATPYFSHLTTSTGGIDCTLGARDFWLLDSSVGGNVSANGRGHVWRTTTTGGGVSLGSLSEVLTSTVAGGVALGDGGGVRASTIGDGIAISGNGTIIGNAITGSIGQGSGEVAHNVVTSGNVSVGSGQMLTNTVRRGGLVAGNDVLVAGNDVENAPGTGIEASGTISVIGNRVLGSGGAGVTASAGLIQGNLIANSAGVGLDIGSATVLSNTLTGNRGSAIRISSGTPGSISGNNLEGNKGAHDIETAVLEATLPSIDASGNWWGMTETAAIDSRIYDRWTDDQLGTVLFSPPLTGPVETAPAYVRAITLTPESPVGIESVTFDVLFSRDMDSNAKPTTVFFATERDTWQTYTTANSGLASNQVRAIAVDSAGNKWFGTEGAGVSLLRANGSWQTYNTGNSELVNNYVRAIAVDAAGNKWFGTDNGVGVLRADGAWQTYDTSNSGLATNWVSAVAVDAEGNKWFSVWPEGNPIPGGVSLLRADGSWQVFNPVNSGLADSRVSAIALDNAGNKWFGTYGGVSLLRADGSWQTYNTGNSGLPENVILAIAVDATGNKWFSTDYAIYYGAQGVTVLRSDGSWQTYNTGNSGLAGNFVRVVAVDVAGNKWFSTNSGLSLLRVDGSWRTYNTDNQAVAIALDPTGNKWSGTLNSGVSLLRGGTDYSASDMPSWPSVGLYRSRHDFSTLIPRGAYSLTVSGARGADGIEIAPYSDFTFTVDYAGGVTDKTPPNAPTVAADTCRNSTASAAASWSAHDAESGINLYSYALGVTSSGTEVVNWTTTPLTTVVRSGLNLLAGQRYHFSVKARNAAGLWSPPASASFLAGVECRRVYLPLVMRGY